MDNITKELLARFNDLKNSGYVKSITTYKNGSGISLEYYLNATGGDFCIPDFGNIELKTVTNYSLARIHLFNSSPDGKYTLPTQWLSKNYGYPDKNFKNIKILSGLVKANQLRKIGLTNYFSININRKMRKIFLEIYDLDKNFLNSDIYWDFDSIEEKLVRKLSKLAIIQNNKLEKNGIFYYSFNNIKIYYLKSFDTFLKLIEDNIISITFKTGIYKSGRKKGKFHDHGTSFDILNKDIEKLYNRIY